MTQRQISATDRISQGASVAQKRLLALLRRIDQSARVIASSATPTANLTASISDAKASLKRSNDLTNLSPKSSFPTTFVARSVAIIRSPFTFGVVGSLVAKRLANTAVFALKRHGSKTASSASAHDAAALRQSLKASVKMARSSLLSRATVAIGSPMTIGQWQRLFCCHIRG